MAITLTKTTTTLGTMALIQREDGTESEMSLFTATSVLDDPEVRLSFVDKISTGK